MERPPSRIARDYNRTPARPVRWAHALLGPPRRWLTSPRRRAWALPLALGAVLVAVLLPFDGPISRASARLNLGGDLRRELEAAQQYGAVGSLLLTAAIIWLLDPARRRRLLDLLAASVLTWLVVILLKFFVGRPRPKFDDPSHFLSPFGLYPLPAHPGVRTGPELHHAWEFWNNISSDLWSFPSSHTAFAVMLSVFLTALYPRLRPLTILLAAIVAACRVLFVAHYPTDVIAGAAAACAISAPAVRGLWGVRALDWFWIRFVDREATPAYPAVSIAFSDTEAGPGDHASEGQRL